MSRLLITMVVLLLLGSCKKAKEHIEEERALNFLDGSEWKITFFIKGSNDISADFSTYIFRFNKDFTINVLRNNTTASTGTWKGDIPNRTISANFPTAAHPVVLLNATWNITQSTDHSVSASTFAGNELRQLKMEKQ